MCRHLAYLGRPVSLAEVVLDPPRGLVVQAMDSLLGTERVQADGFGVGWYDTATGPRPARYRRSVPIWSDMAFRDFASHVRSGAVVAAVRAATPGYAVEESCTQPFRHEQWLFSHNGAVHDTSALRAEQPDAPPPDALARVDSALVFGLVWRLLASGASPGEALVDASRLIRKSSTGNLNLLLTDGVRVAATTAGNSLFTATRDDAVLVVSEPLDDSDSWTQVEQHALVEATVDGITVTPMDLG